MLSRDELVAAYKTVSDKEWAIGGMEDATVFARAIEQAVLAKMKQQEPVLEVIAEPDHWHNGYWYEDTGKSYISEKAIQKLPIGTKLYAAPVQQVGINGLTETETDASASVMGLTDT